MNNLVNIKKDFTPDMNFWELNPQLTIMSPFSKLYGQDISKNKEWSSKVLWAVFFLREPDEEINKFFRFGYEKTLQMLKETYLQDIEEEIFSSDLFIECVNAYEDFCLNAIQRGFLMKKEALSKRAAFLNTAEYNLNTMAKLDLAHSKTISIYKDYEEVERKFLANKEEARLKGGRKLSKAEKKEV